MTDHVARGIEKEFGAYLDTRDLYDLKAKVEMILRPARAQVAAKRFAKDDPDPGLTREEMNRLTTLCGGKRRKLESA